VNKNTVLAFSLILLTLLFFNSPVYNKMYEKIFKKERITHQISEKQQEMQKNSILKTEPNKKDTVYLKANEEILKKADNPLHLNQSDSIKQTQLKGDTLWIENEKILCGITEIGAKIVSLQMKNYYYATNAEKKDSDKRCIDLVANGELGGGNLMVNGQDYDNKKFIPQIKEKKVSLHKNENKTIDFLFSGEGKNDIVKRYSFSGDGYKIGFTIINSALDGKSIVVGWKGGITESENIANSKSAAGVNEPRKVHAYDTKNVAHFQLKKVEKDEESGFYKWAAITSKYFMIALVADTIKMLIF
jgi:YidC/Oxa1 family membrane protein insertase